MNTIIVIPHNVNIQVCGCIMRGFCLETGCALPRHVYIARADLHVATKVKQSSSVILANFTTAASASEMPKNHPQEPYVSSKW